MQVILKKKVKKLGEAGDIATVWDGYARSFLLPQGIAIQATPEKIKQLENQKAQQQGLIEKTSKKEKELFDSLHNKSFTIKCRANEKGHLFAAIDEKIISELCETKAQYIQLDQPIKQVGDYSVGIVIGKHKGSLQLTVSKE